jgi:hypothetical protein
MANPDGPSFLSAPPTVAPSEPRGVVLQHVAATPYRAPGEIATPRPRAIATPRPAKREIVQDALVIEKKGDWDSVGDRAGEHLLMGHGKYSAWIHVVLAFALEVLVLGALPMTLFAGILKLGELGYGIGIAIGAAGAIWIYANRWRCIEAFSSKFCSGLLNLSILYVPFVAFIYANVRGLGKLRRMFGAR